MQMPLPDGVKIRVVRRGDRDSLYRLLAEAGIHVAAGDQSNTLSWIVSHPETEVFIAVDPLDRGVGMISLSHRPTLHLGGRLAYVEALIVTGAMRRRGIGSELLERALARAKMLGCKQVEVAVEGASSRGYLEKRGFAGTGAELMAWKNREAK
jgi:GNAT superfamily N-acetyltransferase